MKASLEEGGGRRSSRRLRNRAITRDYLVAVAGAMFDLYPYEAVSLRRIAAQADVSSEAISRHFPDKADLWRAAMGSEPPVDSLQLRSAPALFEALEALVATRTPGDREPVWGEAEVLVRRLEPFALRDVGASRGARPRPSGSRNLKGEPRMTKCGTGPRALAKAATRERIVTAARSIFALVPYDQARLRDICQAADVSMGAVTNQFVDKAEIWRAAMACEPPGDSALTRAAAPMLAALKDLVALRNDPKAFLMPDASFAAAWRAAEKAIAQAEGDIHAGSPGGAAQGDCADAAEGSLRA